MKTPRLSLHFGKQGALFNLPTRMTGWRAWRIVALLIFWTLVCRVGTPAAFAQASFFDTIFSQADWDITFLARPQPPSGGIAIQVLGPGPNFFQQIEHTLGGTPPSEVLSIHINVNATYNPKIECPIVSIAYSELSRTMLTETGTVGAATGPALRQDGKFYVANFAPTRTDVNGALPSPFITNSFLVLTANDFKLVLGAGSYDNSKHPDFSRSGSPIQFGFARANSHTGPSTVTRRTAIDNWYVFIDQDIPTVADYGDAPDGRLGMQTGYYGMVPVPPTGLIFMVASQSGPAFFPTVQTNSGPFAVMNDLFIAPLPGTLESDAIGPIDADPVFNLDVLADDADNDFADGGGAMVVIFALSPRPPSLFFTLAARAPGGPQGGFWNVGIDLDQNGDWGPGEWVCQDIQFDFGTNDFVLLQSPLFGWGPPGAQFGRLAFPVWARNMVTSEPVSTNTPLSGPPGMQYYAGAGPACGFTHGEVEDYFIEWFPIGQQVTNDPPDEVMFGPDIPAEHLAAFSGPSRISLNQRVEYAVSGPPLDKLSVVYLPSANTGGAAGRRFDLSLKENRFGGIEIEEFAVQVELAATGDKLYVTASQALRKSTLVVYGVPEDRGLTGPGVPSGPNRTPTFGAVMIQVEDAPRITTARIQENQVYLEWTGGKPPYRIEQVNQLGPVWVEAMTTQETIATIPVEGSAGFFRVLSSGN